MSEERTAELLAAIQAGDLEAAQQCLSSDESGEVAQATDEQGVSLLLLAFYHRQPEIAARIADTRDRLGLPFDGFEAAVLGRLDRVRELIDASQVAVDDGSPDGFSLLHLAAFFGQEEVLRFLLDRGADVYAVAQNPTRVQPLHSAAAIRSLEICKQLLDSGADANARQAGGFTALMSAAMHGERELVELLLARGADPALAADDGKTARDLAAEAGNESLLPLLGTEAG